MDIEEKKIEFERERLVAETRLKEKELEIQKQQFEANRKGFFAWAQTPIGAAVIAALLGLFGTVWNGYQSNLVEKRKQESNLILEAIKTNGKGETKDKETAANLILLLDAGLIQLPKENEKKLREIAGDSLPSLPSKNSTNIDDIPTPTLTNDLLERVAKSNDSKTKGQISIDSLGKDEISRYEFIQKYLQSLNYTFDTESGYVNIVGFRQLDNLDKYDDVILLVWNDSSGKHVKEFRASCDPGREQTINPNNPKGVANLMDGQYEFALGILFPGTSRSYEGLRQSGDVTIWRDVNKNFKFDSVDVTEKGFLGFLIQAGGTDTEVGRYGAGSQLIYGGKEGEQYLSFMKIIKDSSQFQQIYRYTLFTVPKNQPDVSK